MRSDINTEPYKWGRDQCVPMKNTKKLNSEMLWEIKRKPLWPIHYLIWCLYSKIFNHRHKPVFLACKKITWASIELYHSLTLSHSWINFLVVPWEILVERKWNELELDMCYISFYVNLFKYSSEHWFTFTLICQITNYVL